MGESQGYTLEPDETTEDSRQEAPFAVAAEAEQS